MTKTYRITLTFQFPAWDERDGIVWHVEAGTRAEALRKARRDADRAGHTGTGAMHGRSTFRAVVA